MSSTARSPLTATSGYSLVELLVSMALTTVIVGATLSGLANVMKGNELVMTVAGMNNSVRAGMDLMVRDFLQVGSGLPGSHAISIPNGNNSSPVLIPGPPDTEFSTTAETLPAVIPFAGGGPTINGVDTDAVTLLMADNAFLDVTLSSLTDTSVVIAETAADGTPGPDIETGPDRVVQGQLMLISKGSVNTLVQVTAVDYETRQLTFEEGDSLNLNQPDAEAGNLAALNREEPANATEPANAAANTRISRIRMISYYLEDGDAAHPRLVRRINNGDWDTFNNNLGTAVATDVIDLQFGYDISNGNGNPSNIEMTAQDMTEDAAGACGASACGPTQIRKITVRLTSQPGAQLAARSAFMSNTLESQVSLRAMAFVDRYQ